MHFFLERNLLHSISDNFRPKTAFCSAQIESVVDTLSISLRRWECWDALSKKWYHRFGLWFRAELCNVRKKVVGRIAIGILKRFQRALSRGSTFLAVAYVYACVCVCTRILRPRRGTSFYEPSIKNCCYTRKTSDFTCIVVETCSSSL